MIGQAARIAGAGVETIRFYERKGYIEQPSKPARASRRYPQTTVENIVARRQGQELGFSLAEVSALLALHADPAADCGDVRERAEAHLDAVERKRARFDEIRAEAAGTDCGLSRAWRNSRMCNSRCLYP